MVGSSQVDPLCGLLFASKSKKIKTPVGDNMIINTTIKAWRDIRYGNQQTLSRSVIGQKNPNVDFFTVCRSPLSLDTNWITVNQNCALNVMLRWGVLFIVFGLVDIFVNTGKM